jgi:hypothetical protein
MCGLMICLQGCSTLKGVSAGAQEGFRKDWQAVLKLNDWMKEHMW